MCAILFQAFVRKVSESILVPETKVRKDTIKLTRQLHATDNYSPLKIFIQIQDSGRKVPKGILGPETKVKKDTIKSTRQLHAFGNFSAGVRWK
jgi:hypothetical protein